MIGRKLLHYEITEKLGEGGMGVVYKARDTHLDRFVAIKVLPPEMVTHAGRKARFVQEAKAASALNHPNIVTIHDIASDAGRDFIVMEYVDGQTLDQLIPRKGMRLNEALKLAVQIAGALARAHSAGIIHRDLKPANVMVDAHGRVKVLDFGLAKLAEQTTSDDDTTATNAVKTEEGAIVGTAAYMSPEQAEGKPVDARSDIFSFGSLLYEMLSGERAFKGDTRISTLAAVLHREPAPMGEEVPPELRRVVGRCLRKDSERRFQTMLDLRVELLEIKDNSEAGGAVVFSSPASRRRTAWIAVAILSTLSVAVLVWYGMVRPAREPSASPMRTSPFTTLAGQESDPDFSPDGNQIAFVWNGGKGDNYDVYVKQIAEETPLRLTSTPEPERFPKFSPDGRLIAFVRTTSAGAEVFMIPALGGSERKISRTSSVPLGAVGSDLFRSITFSLFRGVTWSPDGKTLVMADPRAGPDRSGLSMISLETGEKRELTAPPRGYLDWGPVYSPDGQTLVFSRLRENIVVGDLYLLPLTAASPAGDPKRLTFDESLLGGWDWLADGKSLVVSSNRGGSQALWRFPAGGGPPEQLGRDSAYWPAVSRRGDRLAYTQLLVDANIYRVEKSGAGAAARPPVRLVASTQFDGEPQVSPDGRRIVFSSTRSGSSEIWVADIENRNPVQLTFSKGPHVGSPRWSPNSRSIAFDWVREGHRDIYVVGAEGSLPPRRLTFESSADVRPFWSHDGRWIFFGSNRGGAWQVWKVPAEGGAAVQVTSKGGREAFASVDGRYIYYTKWPEAGIWRMPVEGGEEMRVLDRGEQNAWALGEQGLYLLNDAVPATPVIEFLGFPTLRPVRIAVLTEAARPTLSTSLAVAPGGRWLLYVQSDYAGSDLMLVENFR